MTEIHYISPHRPDKNIGRAYNDTIKHLSGKSWICLHDSDVLFLLPDSKTQIARIVDTYGDQFDLIGCSTNRLGDTHQLFDGEFSSNTDIAHHRSIAIEARERYGDKVEESYYIAGMLMLFNKNTWAKVGGFKENDIRCDYKFNYAVEKCGKKIGIAKGLYVFHAYRLWETDHENARNSTKHLE